MDLPPNIRHHIYDFAGLHVSHSSILLRKPYIPRCWYLSDTCSFYESRGQCFLEQNRSGRFGRLPFHARTLTSLVRVCRSVCLDVMTYFYGSNEFSIFVLEASDFNVLLTIPPLILSSISSLKIQFIYWPLLEPDVFPGSHSCDCIHCINRRGFRNYTLTNTSEQDMDTIWTWETVCRNLAEKIQPDWLNLTVICDTSITTVARQFCQSMMHLPRLRSCAIWLGKSPNYDLSSIARETSGKLTKVPNPLQGSFPFFNLPAEIRLQILGYTQLSPTADESYLLGPLHIFNDKTQASGYLWNRRCCGCCVKTKGIDFCCCPRLRAAFSTSCSCRVVPSQLFLVSKQMSREARFVLFSSNCLNFWTDLPWTITHLKGHMRENLRSIRCMRLIFSSGHQTWNWRNPARFQWRTLVKFIKNNFSLNNLCLIIGLYAPNFQQLPEQDENVTRHVFEVYCEIVLELSALEGLQDLHVEAPWLAYLEKLLEQEVMGQGYNSYHGNRRSKKVWVWDEYHIPGPWPDELPRWHTAAWETAISKHAHRRAARSSDQTSQ